MFQVLGKSRVALGSHIVRADIEHFHHCGKFHWKALSYEGIFFFETFESIGEIMCIYP